PIGQTLEVHHEARKGADWPKKSSNRPALGNVSGRGKVPAVYVVVAMACRPVVRPRAKGLLAREELPSGSSGDQLVLIAKTFEAVLCIFPTAGCVVAKHPEKEVGQR